jgi:hypothetical protein
MVVISQDLFPQPPELEIRDIGELTTDQFRGIFRLTYSGDAHLVLRTKVQVRTTTLKSLPSSNIPPGESAESQATRYSPDDWIARHACRQTTSRCSHAPPVIPLQTQLIRRTRRF